jgi:predicted RNA-binding protein YlxR (DUF448 family)
LTGKRRKHVPLRTCIVCHEKRPKREFVRVVRTPDGAIEIDFRGKLPGRGAYFCPVRACSEAALEQGRLSRLLRVGVSSEDVARLRDAVKVTIGSDWS